ncbi:MAG TPA: hypothetical protein VGU45_02660 [Microvirga sp.]|nr:hypothetical protein [Microvirga sp.]
MTPTVRSGLLALLAVATAGSAEAQTDRSQDLRVPPSLRTPQPEKPAARPAPQPARPQPPASQPAAAPAQQAAPAQPARPAAPMLPGAPWAAPVLPPGATLVTPRQQASRPAGPVQESQLKPDPKNLLDCKDAPRGSVVQAPGPLAQWATVYCTKQGHVLTSNERYYSELPGTRGRARGVLSAAQIGGRQNPGEIGHGAYFTKIEYVALSPADAQKLMGGIDPQILQIVRDKPLFRLSLTTDNGKTYQGVVVDPSKEAFWVLHVNDGKIARGGFTVATVDFVNKRRAQQ